MGVSITVKESIEVDAPRDVVWDFTQNWARRAEWDPAIRRVEILEADPVRVRVHGAGGVSSIYQYKLYRRPERTSVAASDNTPKWLQGGGSWSYEDKGGKTLWTQQNTVKITSGWRAFLFGRVVRSRLTRFTREAMENAKAMIESGSSSDAPDR